MSSRKVAFAHGEYYHLYNRGNSKQTIFHDTEDYQRFINLLYLSNSNVNFKIHFSPRDIFEAKRGEPLVAIGAYCLMPNHFHLLVTQMVDGGTSKFMQKVTTGYSMYYNKKYQRTGTLFEGKFKSVHANNDRYLKYLFSYIHLNPIKLIDSQWKKQGIKSQSKAKNFLLGYEFSSYKDYFGIDRRQKAILTTKYFPEYFPSVKSFTTEIFDWLEYKEF